MSRLQKQNCADFLRLSLTFALATVISAHLPVIAGGNSFFGANAGGSNSSTSSGGSGIGGSSGVGGSTGSSSSPDVDETNVNAGLPGLTTPPAMPPSGDYTDDEKRMQRKYKGNIAHAKQLISRGEGMMKAAGKDDKSFKRGKILKETGEKWLAELKANDPYASDKTLDSKDSASKK